MGAYKYIQDTIQETKKERNIGYRMKLSKWRKEGTVVNSEYPENLPKARRLGYKAKKGYITVRVRIKKGLRRRPTPKGGRQAKHQYLYTQPATSHQTWAEQKANRKHSNCEVLGSYLIADDGQYKYFEIVLADRDAKTVKTTAVNKKKKALRGLTSSGRKARKRKKTEKKSKKKTSKKKR
ncbi:50S ribosomal protein L15e [Candidatus Micrarchaeota archaeon]|nr:50S ribosomal protein L15e [Candidatus Micrarchaeota archaeon]